MHPYFRLSLTLLAVCVGLSLLLLAAVNGNAQEKNPLPHEEILEPADVLTKDTQHIEKVKSGDTAGLILNRLGFSGAESANIIQAAKPVYPLKNIHIGHKFIRMGGKSSTQVIYQIDEEKQIVVSSQLGKKWTVKIEPRRTSFRIDVVEATIYDSLFYDANKAGLKDSLTIKLVDIFAWDIDFARDLRKGDSFKVMYQESFDDEGSLTGYKILAAKFKNRGFVYTALRYENKNGDVEYFDEEGRNLRKTYLKSPVKYSRISSRFRSSRKHPVLGYTRAHRGVDYAAKAGTPIRSIGDGKVVYKGRKGGYGRFVEVRHTNGIHSTAYAHMRRYGKSIKKGRHVKQGQILGYVGMSGLATGPHLHFEFRSRGRAVNPLKVKYKAAKSVPKSEMSAFHIKAKELLRSMDTQGQSGAWG